MDKEDAEKLAGFLAEVLKSNMSDASKCFYTLKMTTWLAEGGWRLTLGVEPVA